MSHKVLYSKLFTPPKFLEMPSVSLEILPKGISYLLIKNTEVGPVPDIFGFIPLPPGTISQGEIIRREPVIKALVEIKRKTKVSFARLSLPEEKTYLFKTHLPLLSAKEMRDILDFKIEENVPLSSKEAVFDFDIIPQSQSTTGIDVAVSVTSLKTVEEMQEILTMVGLTPVFFGPESNNVARSVVRENNEQVITIVNIREDSIVFSLVINGVVCQTSSLGFGSSVFTDSLSKYFKVPPEEIQKIKCDKLYNDNPDNLEIFSYLINTISAIKDELYKFITYCNEKESSGRPVDRVIICGQDSLIVGFEKYLATNLDLKVDIANVWVNNFEFDDHVPEISRSDSLDLAVLNGLSLF